jgi:hypothetical protein
MLSKIRAIEKLQTQIDQIPIVKSKQYGSPEFTKWRRDTQVTIENIFGSSTRHIKDFNDIEYLCFYSSSEQKDFVEGLMKAESVIKSMIDEINDFWNDSPSMPTVNQIQKVEKLCNRFPLAARQIRSRYKDRKTLAVEDEYDVQDLLHTLLTLEFDDIRSEEWTPSYAGSSSRMDFLLKQDQIVIETKKTRIGLGAKEVGDQLIIDINKYQSHPDCLTLVCFVYDPEGRIGNPRGIENDLSRENNGFLVKVIISPKGY